MQSADNFTHNGKLKNINWIAENTPAHWFHNQPFLSYLGNAFIIVTPEIERFGIKAIKFFKKNIKDEQLKSELDVLIREEAAHAYQHNCVTNDLKRHKYPIGFMMKYSRAFFWLASKVLNNKNKIAFFFSMEFYAHQLALASVEHNLFPEDELAIYDFLRWHAAEEMAHPNLCFRLYHHIGGGYIQRVLALMFFLFFMLITAMLFVPMFFCVDVVYRSKMTFKNLPRSIFYIFKYKSIFFDRLRAILAFLNPKFIPETTKPLPKQSNSIESLPYFEFLFQALAQQNSFIIENFNKHVHFGYWPEPSRVQITQDGYSIAANYLSQKICSFALIGNNQTVLDVGCGFGGTISQLDQAYSKMNLTGLDIDHRQLEQAKCNVISSNNNQIDFVKGSAYSLPFKAQHFDQLLAIDVMFHLANKQAFFEEASRVLKTEGSLTLSDYVPHPLLSLFTWILNLSWIKPFNFFGSCHINCTMKKYKRLAAQYGLEMDILDITKNVAPTCKYLNYIVQTNSIKQPYKAIANEFVLAVRFLLWSRLLRYKVIVFKKNNDLSHANLLN